MWWLRGTYALALGLWIALAGCGSGGSDPDRQTMSFVEFTGEGIEQEDTVGNTSADVDVCPTICEVEGLFDFVFEQFTTTRVNAVFVNRGKADIVLDHYTVTIEGSNIPSRSAFISRLLPGGRCENDSERKCGTDLECGEGLCTRESVMVELLLVDFVEKELLRGGGECPTIDLNSLIPTAGTIVPHTYQMLVDISGSDERGKRYSAMTGLLGAFDDFDNCE